MKWRIALTDNKERDKRQSQAEEDVTEDNPVRFSGNALRRLPEGVTQGADGEPPSEQSSPRVLPEPAFMQAVKPVHHRAENLKADHASSATVLLLASSP